MGASLFEGAVASTNPVTEAAQIGSEILAGIIHVSKTPQRVQQAAQMFTAVQGGNLSALRRLIQRSTQFADTNSGFVPALQHLQAAGVLDGSYLFIGQVPWTEEGHAELFDGPPVFSETRPAGAVSHPEAAVNVPLAGPISSVETLLGGGGNSSSLLLTLLVVAVGGYLVLR